MKKLLVLSAVLYAGNSMAMEYVLLGVCQAVAGNPLRGARTAFKGVQEDAHAHLQKGKAMLRQKGEDEGWSADQKHKANIAYKEIEPFWHRAGSPDVFPGY